MRLRTLSAAATAVLAAVSLSGCRTNVGVAATVDGHRISESDVSQLLTAKAEPVQAATAGGGSITISPRSYVLGTLIEERLLTKLLAASPDGMPTEGQIADTTSQGLNGSTPAKVAASAGLLGFSDAFDRQWVRYRVLGSVLRNAAQQGLDVQALVAKVRFPVSVNPRYGTWDERTLTLASDTGAGLPDFLKLQPGPTTGPSDGATESAQPVR